MKTAPATPDTGDKGTVVDPQDGARLALALARLRGTPFSLGHRAGPNDPLQVRP